MNPAVLATLIPLLTKVPGALKALYKSKHFWPAAIGGGFIGQELLSQSGKAGERKLSREELALQKAIALASAEATEKATKESRANTKEYVKELRKVREEEIKREREAEMMQSFMSSQDRQMALVMQAMGALNNRPVGSGTQAPTGGGMLGLMRGSY